MVNNNDDLAEATVEMSATDFEMPTDGNNNPEKQLDRENLELDTGSVDRLSVKPVQKYRFIRSVGRGGMKMVLQMKDLDATRDVAMAVLPEATTRPKEDLVRFIQEARITASLEHPNIVPVHEIGVDSTGAPYYTMKLLRGKTLAALITKLAGGDEKSIAEYNAIRLLRIFLKICNGVAFAHSKGVIHLDLKPENIQVGDFGEVLIMDWGLAKVRDQEKKDPSAAEDPAEHTAGFTGGTLDGIMKGTPGYMAPEQAAGKNSMKDERTDVYALGAILYTMMTWKDPLEQKVVRERIAATLAGNIVPPHERAPEREIPAGVEAVILKAMSLNPEDRYQSVRELREEVNAFIGGYATIAEKASIAKKTLLFFRRHLLLTVLLAVILFFACAGGLYMLQEYRRSLNEWQEVYSADFQNTGAFHAAAPDNRIRRPVRNDGAGGVLLNTGEWLWLNHAISGDVRLEITFSVIDPSETELNIVLFGKDAPLKNPDAFPAGWCIRLASHGGWDQLCRVTTHGETSPLPLAVTASTVVPGTNTLIVIRQGNRLQIYSNTKEKDGSPCLDTVDLVPSPDKNTQFIGFRSLRTPVKITGLKIFQQTMPGGPAPLYRGQVLAEEGLFSRALDHYLMIAKLYPNETFADEALTRAYRIASFQLADQPEYREQVRNMIDNSKAFTRSGEIRELDALYLWHCGHYQEALNAADQILAGKPDSKILLQFLTMPRKKVTDFAAKNFLRKLAESQAGKNARWLDLSDFNLSSLEPLKEMKSLQWLNCSGNQLSSIADLNECPLLFLDCSRNPDLQDKTAAGNVKILIKD